MKLIERSYIKLGYDEDEDGEVFIQYLNNKSKISFCFYFHSFRGVLNRVFKTLKIKND